MILAKGVGAALALAVMAGFVGQASAGVREYCDSYARDVANRKTDGGAGALVGQDKNGGTGGVARGVGGTVLGAGVTGDRYKRAYTNAYERCVANYEGAREPEKTAEGEPPDQKVMVKQTVVNQTTDDKAVANAAADDKVVASEAADKKAAASKASAKKVAATEATQKKAAASESIDRDKACARKYRSYDPKIGKYKSMSGKWRPCRL
jgi:hypothetical protein